MPKESYMRVETVDPVAVADMDYSRFVGFIRERNRPSGGIRSVQEATIHARIGRNSRVLEIGSNTGFASVNIALLTGASVVGIDLQEESVAEATRYARQQGVADRVDFRVGDVRSLRFSDGEFDAVWVSNVVSFVADQHAMLSECQRVLAPGGTLITIPIYYREQPPQALVDRVSAAIANQIDVRSKSSWRTFFESRHNLELYHEADYDYVDRTDQEIVEYCDTLLSKEHLRTFTDAQLDQIRDRASEFMMLFNENLRYTGFSVMLFQKRLVRDEVELFLSRPAVSPSERG
ncbi:methyltransferase domain-containing protein [Solwaraspora sp. WMMD406]|uniref:class I SAM-dependent methyltransferase n=1 Tax=Solwaraspora sp. WMMD406 TaxID=3016095 RepID=UPI002415D105|nr:class I SAM-dependent methyltransferase [Solwaraspora sp. WMMD406]MDG4763002.1 methyltransferase domain-containing protein [Solwaraspora sp. WMMD406]